MSKIKASIAELSDIPRSNGLLSKIELKKHVLEKQAETPIIYLDQLENNGQVYPRGYIILIDSDNEEEDSNMKAGFRCTLDIKIDECVSLIDDSDNKFTTRSKVNFMERFEDRSDVTVHLTSGEYFLVNLEGSK